MNHYGIEMKGAFIVEEVTSLPTGTSTDKKRLIYYNNKYYFGADSEGRVLMGSSSSTASTTGETMTYESLTSLPAGTSDDEGRFIYHDGKFYYGSDTEGVELYGISAGSSVEFRKITVSEDEPSGGDEGEVGLQLS